MELLQIALAVTLVAFCASREPTVCTWPGATKQYEEGEQYFNYNKCTLHRCIDGKWEPERIGCQFMSLCKMAGQVWTHDCTTYVCRAFGDGKTSRIILDRECSLPNGTCVEKGTTFRNGCHFEKCKKVGNTEELAMQAHTFGCRWIDNQCYEEGQKKVSRCNVYQCQRVKGGNYEFRKFKLRCRRQGLTGCVDIGGTWKFKFSCINYECKKDKDREGKETTRVHKTQGCRWRGKCYALGEVLRLDRCNKLVCVEANGWFNMDHISTGCKAGRRCKDRGAIWNNKCRQLECPRAYSYRNYEYIVNHPGCPEMNSKKCRNPGDKWVDWSKSKKLCYDMKCTNKGRSGSADGTCRVEKKCYRNGDVVPGPEGRICTCEKGDIICKVIES